MTRQDAIDIQKQITKAIEPILKKNKLVQYKHSGRYGAELLKVTYEFHEVAKGETLEDVARKEFKQVAHLYGLKAEDFGKQFVNGGKRFVVAGIKRKAHRYPILATEVKTGKRFKFSSNSIRLYLERSL